MTEVMAGRLDFERCFATADTMPVLARAARILGPKGLMPNPKRGTVITNVADAVRRAKGGEIEFRANKAGAAHTSIGRINFEHAHLRENALSWLCAATCHAC